MKPNGWQQVNSIYHDALDVEPDSGQSSSTTRVPVTKHCYGKWSRCLSCIKGRTWAYGYSPA